jgi:hypothetical protein
VRAGPSNNGSRLCPLRSRQLAPAWPRSRPYSPDPARA